MRAEQYEIIEEGKPMTEAAKLEDGFYWVRRNWSINYEVARYSKADGAFFLIGQLTGWHQSAFIEIDPRPIKRDGGE